MKTNVLDGERALSLSESDNGFAVKIDSLSFSYGKLAVLDGLSIAMPYGASYGLLGPNGAGKSTLIRLLIGLLKPQNGDMEILGQSSPREVAVEIGYMPQLSALYSELSVLENVDFYARVYGLRNKGERREKVSEAIRLVELWERRKSLVQNLSGGMRQRVSLACAIVHQPSLLLLDEPTVGLDPELRYNFWNHFHDWTQQGMTLIISSHTMDDAAHCDRLAFLKSGRVIADGTPQELVHGTGDPRSSLEDAFLHYVRSGDIK